MNERNTGVYDDPVNSKNPLNTDELAEKIIQNLELQLIPYGFEIAPFLSSWYDAFVSSNLKLIPNIVPHDDCLAICIISNPSMFEKNFLPILSEFTGKISEITSFQENLEHFKLHLNNFEYIKYLNDPLDWSIYLRLQEALNKIIDQLKMGNKSLNVEQLNSAKWIPDFAKDSKTQHFVIHVQSAGHAAGITYFHEPPSELKTRKKENSKFCYCGFSTHPKYGGWFGFRGIYVFPDLRCPNLSKRQPISYLNPGHPPFSEQLLNKLFYEYNENWSEARWRNCGSIDLKPAQTYSVKAQTYFNTHPLNRLQLIKTWLDEI